MKRVLMVSAVMALIGTACAGDAAPTSTTTTPPLATSTSASTTSTLGTTTTSTVTDFPSVDLPVDGDCSIDIVPDSGEPTVLVEGRLYGLGVDGASPRCLVAGIVSTDFEWGPLGDRIRVGDQILTSAGSTALPAADSYEWTAPTGSRVLAISPNRMWKVGVDDLSEIDITFLSENLDAAYHPAGEHLLAIGTDADGQYGLWLASNQGTDPLLLAFDGLATMSDPVWSWLNEPVFVAKHVDGPWHIHRVELTAEGSLDGPILVEVDETVDMLVPSRFDPVLLAFRLGGQSGLYCVDGARVALNGVDLPEPVASMTSTPVGWLSSERLLLLTYPDGCDAPGDLWSFSAGFCPGSVYGVTPIISGVDGAAAREAAPPAPPPPDFTGIIDPGPA